MTTLERDFELFFNNLTKQHHSAEEIQYICKPLKDYYICEKFKKYFKICVFFGLCYVLLISFDSLSWLASAFGRLFLIELLPYWNWPELYNEKCLVSKTLNVNENTPVTKLERYETEKENCLLCDNIDYIPSLTNASYTYVESIFLERSYPVIVTDSHAPLSLHDFYQLVFNKSFDFLESNPCDVSTNLMLIKFFDIEIAIRKASSLNTFSDKWFLQLRNCQFKAVKSSRNFIKRPYFYPVHLEPFYSSWLIISHNYSHNHYQQEILLDGLVIVQQLWGVVDVMLTAKEPCSNCPLIKVHLKERESLIFSTDLWLFSYKFLNSRSESITTITETQWNI